MAGIDDDAARSVARARQRFLELGGAVPDPGRELLRDGIVQSWRRSQVSGVDIDRLDPPYTDDLDTDCRLMHAARPVLDRLSETLAGAPMSVILTDARGRVLERRTDDVRLGRELDRLLLATGFSYAEQHVGTNGIGTALEAGKPFQVIGGEHFSERLQSMACAGAPIRNPTTSRMAGLLDITCRNPDATPLMRALADNAARGIEERLLELGAERERAMLAEFLAACKHSSHPIVSVSDNLIMTNPQAAVLLEPSDHAIVRDKLAELLQSRRQAPEPVRLASGQLVTLRCRSVTMQAGTAGAVVEITPAQERRARTTTICRSDIGLAGRSAAFSAACAAVEQHCRARTWVFLEGEPGVGKLALVVALHRRYYAPAALIVIEPDEIESAGDRLAAAVGAPEGTVVLRHPERFPAAAWGTLADWMDTVAGLPARPRLVATAPSSAELPEALLSRFTATVTIPALRHRIEDVPEIVPALLRRLAPGRSLRCSAAAMRVLQRATWPGNVAELADALRVAVSRRRVGEIRLEDLPEALHVTSRHVLTPWEALERDAIVRALLETNGDKIAAAKLLGISRATIYRKVNSYGISID